MVLPQQGIPILDFGPFDPDRTQNTERKFIEREIKNRCLGLLSVFGIPITEGIEGRSDDRQIMAQIYLRLKKDGKWLSKEDFKEAMQKYAIDVFPGTGFFKRIQERLLAIADILTWIDEFEERYRDKSFVRAAKKLSPLTNYIEYDEEVLA